MGPASRLDYSLVRIDPEVCRAVPNGHELLRAVLAVLVALGLYLVCLVSGTLLQASVTASAAATAAPAEPTEREIQRGPERGA